MIMMKSVFILCYSQKYIHDIYTYVYKIKQYNIYEYIHLFYTCFFLSFLKVCMIHIKLYIHT